MVLTQPQQINDTTVPAGTYIKSAYIHEASIDTLKIRSQAVSVVSAVSRNVNSVISRTEAVYLDAQGGTIKVDLIFVGFEPNGTTNITIYANGNAVAAYGAKGSGQASSMTIPAVISSGYGMTSVWAELTNDPTVISYVLTATALKR